MNGNYTHEPKFFQDGDCEGDIMTVADYLDCVENGMFIDYDGSGHPMKDGKIDRKIDIYPSNKRHGIPEDATHICWYNR